MLILINVIKFFTGKKIDKKIFSKNSTTECSQYCPVFFTVILQFWRSKITRKLTKQLRTNELQVLRVVGANELNTLTHEVTIEEIAEARRALARRNEKQYQTQQVAIKKQLRETETPAIVNHIESQIRQWFLEYRDATGRFPDYPDVEAGGSASLFENRNPQEIAVELDTLRIEREKAEAERLAKEGKGKDKKGKGKGGTDKKDKKDKNGEKNDKKKKASKDAKKGRSKKNKGKWHFELNRSIDWLIDWLMDWVDDWLIDWLIERLIERFFPDEEDEGWKPVQPQSAFLSSMKESMIVFHDFWEDRDGKNNPHQEFDADIVKAEKRKELKEEVRVDVDVSMRKELDFLKLAIDGQKPKKDKRKKKGKGKKKNKKDRKEKDLTPNRTPESIFEGIVIAEFFRSITFHFLTFSMFFCIVRFVLLFLSMTFFIFQNSFSKKFSKKNSKKFFKKKFQKFFRIFFFLRYCLISIAYL